MIKRNKLVLEGGPIAKDKREKMTPLTIAMLVVLIIFAISLLGILVWAFIISFKDERWITYYNDSYFFPQFWRNNFGLAFQGLTVTIDGVNQNLPRLFLNSFIYIHSAYIPSQITGIFPFYSVALFQGALQNSATTNTTKIFTPRKGANLH